ncbi:Hypothetical protein, putative [Bodo saltans]|uniref:BRCT domain-containing protein n=1 Tax=Bodo saltans TaxID=75058 RepID=A0A0S4IRM7_BODSA|nr:Hypothetical protein, putative [Bodo saltans]|eukprot:CUF35367.1 Hypothetical protein, putative [Bodo saltans]
MIGSDSFQQTNIIPIDTVHQYRTSIDLQRSKLIEAYSQLLDRVDVSLGVLTRCKNTIDSSAIDPYRSPAPALSSASPLAMVDDIGALWFHVHALLHDARKMSKLLSQNIPAHFHSCASLMASAVLQQQQCVPDAQVAPIHEATHQRLKEGSIKMAHTILASACSSPVTQLAGRLSGSATQPSAMNGLSTDGAIGVSSALGTMTAKRDRKYRFVTFLPPSPPDVAQMLASAPPMPPSTQQQQRDVDGNVMDPVPLVAAVVGQMRTGIAVLHGSVLVDLIELVSLFSPVEPATTVSDATEAVTVDPNDIALRIESLIRACDLQSLDGPMASQTMESSGIGALAKWVIVLPFYSASPLHRCIRMFHQSCQATFGVNPNGTRDANDNIVKIIKRRCSSPVVQSLLIRVAKQFLFLPGDAMENLIGGGNQQQDARLSGAVTTTTDAVRGTKFQVSLGPSFPRQRSHESLNTTTNVSYESTPRKPYAPYQSSHIDDSVLYHILQEIEHAASVGTHRDPWNVPQNDGDHDATCGSSRKRSRSPEARHEARSGEPHHHTGGMAPLTVTLRRRRSRSLLPHDSTGPAGTVQSSVAAAGGDVESQDVQFDASDDDDDDEHRAVALPPRIVLELAVPPEQRCYNEAQHDKNGIIAFNADTTVTTAETTSVENTKTFLNFQMTNSIRDKRREIQQLLTAAPLSQAAHNEHHGLDQQNEIPVIAPPAGACGKMDTASHYLKAADILLVADGVMERTEKYLSFCASGKPIVSPRYVTDSVSRGVWLPLDDKRRALEYELSPARRRFLLHGAPQPPIAVTGCLLASTDLPHSVWIPSCAGISVATPTVRPFEQWRVVLFASKQVGRGIQSILEAGGCAHIVADPHPPDLKLWKAREATPIVSTLPCGAVIAEDGGNSSSCSSSQPLMPTVETRCVPRWLADFVRQVARKPPLPSSTNADDDVEASTWVDVETSDLLRCFSATNKTPYVTHILVEGPLVGDMFVAPQQLPSCFVDGDSMALKAPRNCPSDAGPSCGNEDPAEPLSDGRRNIFSLELLYHVLCVAKPHEFCWESGTLTDEGERTLPAVCRLVMPS